MDGKLIWLLCFILVTKNHTSTGNGNADDLQSNKEDQMIGSVQLGIQYVMKNADYKTECNVVMPDFLLEEKIVFPQNGAGQTPNHSFPEFTFISYAPIIFHHFRNEYKIKYNEFKESFGSSPLREFLNPGHSGSLFYVTHDDKFVMKTLTQEESEYLRRLLPGYHLNLKQNPSTLLPKFFGLYRYQRNSNISTSLTSKKEKNIDIVGMNNLIPSHIKIHKKYDLKGIMYGRRVLRYKKNENNRTFKDLDFDVDFPNGILLDPGTYEKLVDVLEKDCAVLKSSKTIDYSLLMSVHYVDRDEEEKGALTTGKIARKSIKDVENIALPLSGLRALSGSGERLLLFFGIIDVLQCFDSDKNTEHMLKASKDDTDPQNPEFYASRFFKFITKKVFKISMFPSNQWGSALENDSSDMRADLHDSVHTGKAIAKETTGAKRDSLLTKVNKKIGKIKVGKDGVITYNNISTDQIMGSVQLGIHHVVKSLHLLPERGVLMSDFVEVKDYKLPHSDDKNAQDFRFPEFTFKSYAPFVFNDFRKLYGIHPNDYHKSFCSSPLRQLPNPSASGSLIYTTNDDKFLMKTVLRKENKFIQKLLTGNFWNFDQNPDTLLPKFFGYYIYECNSNNIKTKIIGKKYTKKRIKLMVMNNLLPSNIEIHEKYDLKGSIRHRKASLNEKKKQNPTYRDLDFKEMHPGGIFLEPDVYTKLFEVMANDCRVLKSFEIMDYSLLMGVHYLNRDETPKKVIKFQHSFYVDVHIKFNSTPIRGIPAWKVEGKKKEQILLLVGIIDVIHTYGWKKKLENKYKSFVYKKEDSVVRPDVYATRFLKFMSESVFKKLSDDPENSSSTFEETICWHDQWDNQEWLRKDPLPWM